MNCAAAREPAPTFLRRTDLRLLLFGGKGGVGKTTCAAAAALSLASPCPRTSFLLVSTDPAHSLQRVLGESPLPPNLELLELDARQLLQEHLQAHSQHLRAIAQRGTFLDDEDVTRLLEVSLPGLDELMAFLRIAELLEGRSHTCIIVDTAPTGHTLRLLGMPAFCRRWLAALDALLAKHRCLAALYRGGHREDEAERFLGRLGETLEALGQILQDQTRCLFVPVLQAQPLVVAETQRLVRDLEDQGVPVTDLIINGLHPERARCRVCSELARRERTELGPLLQQFARYGLWALPLLGTEPHGPSQLGAFWAGARPIHTPGTAPHAGEPTLAAR